MRYTSLQLAILGFEAVWLSLASRVLGERAGGAIAWLPLFLAGGAALAWNRLLLSRELWQSGLGRGAALVGAVAVLLALLAATAPQESARLLHALRAARPFAEVVRLIADSPPLVIGLLAGLTLLARVLALLRAPLTLWETVGRLRVGVGMVVVMLVLATGQGGAAPSGSLLLFFGCALLSLALARAHEVGRGTAGARLPFTRGWLLNVAGGVAVVLLVGGLASQPISLHHLASLRALLLLLRDGVAGLLAYLVDALFSVLVPIVQWLWALAREAVVGGLLPLLARLLRRESAGDMAPLDPRLLRVLAVALLILFTIGPLVLLNYLYRLYRALTGRDERAEGELSRTDAPDGGLRAWLRGRRAALRALLARLLRPTSAVGTVRELYKQLLRFGDAHGLARPSKATPYDYLAPLCRRYPERTADFHALTDAYVAARYGEQSFSPADIAHLQAAWQRIAETDGETAGVRG